MQDCMLFNNFGSFKSMCSYHFGWGLKKASFNFSAGLSNFTANKTFAKNKVNKIGT